MIKTKISVSSSLSRIENIRLSEKVSEREQRRRGEKEMG